jgi:ATP-binding cassette, subfamily C (CFTR/MRP), member 1
MNLMSVNSFSQDMRLLDMTLPNSMISVSFRMAPNDNVWGKKLTVIKEFINTIWSAILTSVAVWYMIIPLSFLVVLVYGVQKFYLRTSRQLRLLE